MNFGPNQMVNTVSLGEGEDPERKVGKLQSVS